MPLKPFEKGNKAARGGRRLGAGRKPKAIKKAAAAFYEGFVDAAEKVVRDALKAGDHDMARWVLEGHYGKHIQRMEVHTPGATLQDPLDRENARVMAALGKEA